MNVYVLANCMGGYFSWASLLPGVAPNHRSVLGVTAETLIALLEGRRLQPNLQEVENVRQAMVITRQFETLATFQDLPFSVATDFPTLVFPPLTEIDGLIWSPFADAMGGSQNFINYPVFSWRVQAARPVQKRATSADLLPAYMKINSLSASIRKRALVFYPTDNMLMENKDFWRSRCAEINTLARSVFSTWKAITFDPEPSPDGNWSHYSAASGHKASMELLNYMQE